LEEAKVGDYGANGDLLMGRWVSATTPK
jgi:hypothetical protein